MVDLPPALPPERPLADTPSIVQPAPHQAFFGKVVAVVPSGTEYAVLLVDGDRKVVKVVRGTRVSLQLPLPPRDVTLRVVAVDDEGRRRRSPPVGPVLGLPPPAAPRVTRSAADPVLMRRVKALARAFRGTAGVYVEDLGTGRGAAWNAKARFPAASTLKLAIAVETLRALNGPPARGSSIDALMRSMLIQSDNAAANRLEVFFGGSTSGGSAKVNAMMRSLGLVDSEMYGGYELDTRAAARAIPIRTESQPAISNTKYTTAWDLGRLARFVHLAAGGRGPLIRRVRGYSVAEARYLLYVLAHVGDRGKLARFLPRRLVVAHKAGWIGTARHDNGIVYWPGGALVASVLAWSPAGVGSAADVLAGRVAQAALDRFNETEP
jgi:beta-lactamase class A